MGWRSNGSGPCAGCERSGCGAYHDQCEKYQAWLAKVRQAHEREREFLQSRDVVSDQTQKRMWRKLRYSRKTKPAR